MRHATMVLSHAFREVLGGGGATHAAWPWVGLRAPVSGPSGSFLVQLLELSFEDSLNVREGEGTDRRAPGLTDLPEDSHEGTHCALLPVLHSHCPSSPGRAHRNPSRPGGQGAGQPLEVCFPSLMIRTWEPHGVPWLWTEAWLEAHHRI